MSNKPPIKIIKKNDRRPVAKTRRGSQSSNQPTQDPAVTMARTVTGWVRDFKKNGKAEAGKLLTTVLENPPHPNEA